MPTSRITLWLACTLPFALAVACGPDEHRPTADDGGFLGDYSQLRPQRGDDPQRLYIDLDTDFSTYPRVIVDPVVVWRGAGSRFEGVSDQALAALADYLRQSIRDELAQEYAVVDDPAEGTLRLRVGIIEVRGSPKTETGNLEGSVVLEAEVLDAVSGERLIAVADSRGEGTEPTGSANSEETEVRAAVDAWARRARVGLSAFRDFDSARAGGAEGS